MGDVSIKMYDKFNHVLRIESTCNDIGNFRVKRQVEHRDGRSPSTRSNQPCEYMTFDMHGKDIRQHMGDISSSSMSRIYKRPNTQTLHPTLLLRCPGIFYLGAHPTFLWLLLALE